MAIALGWMQLRYQKVRLAVAISGIAFAVILILMQLGFRASLLASSVRYQERLRYDVAMIIVDHHLDLALALSDRTVVLERGAVTWTGPSHALRDDLALRRKMLWM